MARYLWVVISMGLMNSLAQAGVQSVSSNEAALWRRSLIPLPHYCAVTSVYEAVPGVICVTIPPQAGPAIREARCQIETLLETKTGTKPGATGVFEIALGVLDSDLTVAGRPVKTARRLDGVPNRSQAYVIEPDGERRLIVAGVTETGVYYGAQTVIQWLEFNASNTVVRLPLAHVADWPDVEERGLWNFPTSLVPWLSSLKLNYGRVNTRMMFSTNETVNVIPASMYDWPVSEDVALWTNRPWVSANRYAYRLVPTLTHLNMWHSYGLGKLFPDVIGIGERAKCPASYPRHGHIVLCAANPRVQRLVAAGICDLAAQGAGEVSVWTSEEPGQCECKACLKEGQFKMEARAILAAWREAQKTYPDLRLRLFFGIGGGGTRQFPTNEIADILRDLPAGVKLGVAGGIPREMTDAYAARGGWIGDYVAVYLSSYWQHPPGNERTRLTRNVETKWSGCYMLMGYPTYYFERNHSNYRICGLAEWTWNAHGRSEREFSEAWATRQGYAHSERFGEWVALMEPIESARRGGLPGWLCSLPERLQGTDVKDPVPAARDLESLHSQCRQAAALAPLFNAPEPTAFSSFFLAVLDMEAAALTLLPGTKHGDPNWREEAFKKLQTAAAAYDQAVDDLAAAWQLDDKRAAAFRKTGFSARQLAEKIIRAHPGRTGSNLTLILNGFDETICGHSVKWQRI